VNTTLKDGLRIIEHLANASGPEPLTAIAEALGIGNSKTHRLLQTLIENKYVFQLEDSRQYQASIKLWALGSGVLRHASLKAMAESEMQRLMEATGESVHLSVLEGAEIVYVHKVESTNPVRAYSQIGGRMPAFQVATGKAMLAFKSSDALDALLNNLLEKGVFTARERTAFLKEINTVRTEGFAVNRGQVHKDVYGVAAPIIEPTGQVLAAIGVSGPAHRFTPRRLAIFADEVRQSAGTIAHRLFGASRNRLW
jgi:DNA-binding IclR family transcriptional regulator